MRENSIDIWNLQKRGEKNPIYGGCQKRSGVFGSLSPNIPKKFSTSSNECVYNFKTDWSLVLNTISLVFVEIQQPLLFKIEISITN